MTPEERARLPKPPKWLEDLVKLMKQRESAHNNQPQPTEPVDTSHQPTENHGPEEHASSSTCPRQKDSARVDWVPPQDLLQQNWANYYADSPYWQEIWDQVHNPGEGDDWPIDTQLQGEKLYIDQKLCVPECVTERLILAQHILMGHCGIKKLTAALRARYLFSPDWNIADLAKTLRKMCITCQATEPPNWQGKGPISMTPIPNHVMSSVCLDIFSLPPVTWGGQNFDTLVVCVDRLSGWIIAKPTLGKGLTAKRTAHLLMDGGWETYGIPSLITCDQGPQFAGQWFRTMCARLGIRLVFSQAYRPQANGRAEVAGKSIKNL